MAALAAAAAMLLATAPQAAAEITSLSARGDDYGIPCGSEYGCNLYVGTDGEDWDAPVTFLIDGEVLGTVTPGSHTGEGPGSAWMDWDPAVDTTYTITVVQGESSRSMTITLPYERPRVTTFSGVPLSGSGVGSAG